MSRMTWTGDRARAPETRAARLGDADVSALERLYADGESSGEAPDFFGIYQGSDLLAAAGTHLLSPDEGAAAIGNIYTRRDRRGRGLGRIVTASVMRELAGVETVGLNVRADNAPAIRLYESLGFTRHCEFYEAMATR